MNLQADAVPGCHPLRRFMSGTAHRSSDESMLASLGTAPRNLHSALETKAVLTRISTQQDTTPNT